MGNSALSPLSLLSLPAFFVERTDVLFSLSGCQQFECERARGTGGRESRSWLEGPEMGSRRVSLFGLDGLDENGFGKHIDDGGGDDGGRATLVNSEWRARRL